ncbi:MAG: multiheme c-type cytochrome [Planctomycetota bacterium]
MRSIKRRSVVVAGICCFIAVIMGGQAGLGEENSAGYEQGLMYYELNETDKAIKLFKEELARSFAEPVTGQLQKAANLTKNNKTDEAEIILLSLLDDEETAARARYELGLIYESRGELDAAAAMFRNAQVVITDKGAAYLGVKNCKKCHLKQYKTWKTTKMAKTFDVLKPGVRAEAKAKLKFDPQKDYTKDTKCLECHTSGFGMPGGYKIPEAGDSKAARRAKDNAGVTCEGCHGPGSKYVAIHKKAITKKRKYTLDELYQAGQYKVDVKTCTTCHNRRNPTVGSDYHFDYEKYKAEDTHENFPLKYRVNE